VDDRRPVPALVKELWGKLIADKGYISGALTTLLSEHGLQLVTKIKSNIKQHAAEILTRVR
ncbi:MAG: transposase, partial [Acidobacteriota bacterium]|nr:transposase [Acidobacteriota bacterium]